jgi:protein arginine kinase
MDDLLNKDYVKWLDSQGSDSSIVISSRVRLARNLQGLPFPHLLNEEKGALGLNLIHNAWQKIKNGTDLEWADLKDLNDIDKTILVEKHLLSPAYIQNSKPWQAFITNTDGARSVMLNEEDHLRLQCLLPGLQLGECLKQVLALDDLLEKELDYAFDERRGYLTSCPTNVGTGMRASVMLHLPAIQITGQLNSVIQTIAQLGMTVRGLYGEGSEASGNFYHGSNQVTLGQTEEDICNYLQMLTRQLVEQEKILRQNLQQKMKDQLEDRINALTGF